LQYYNIKYNYLFILLIKFLFIDKVNIYIANKKPLSIIYGVANANH